MRRSLPLLTLGAAAIVSVGACSSSQPQATGHVPAAPTLRLSTPPPTPSAAPSEGTSDADVLAAVRRYNDAFVQSFRTGAQEPYDRMTAAECPCRAPIHSALATLRTEGWTTTLDSRITNVTLAKRVGVGAKVEVHLDGAPYKILDKTGAVVRDGKPSTNHDILNLIYQHGRWIVVRVDPVKP
jgi:hypothetical protein